VLRAGWILTLVLAACSRQASRPGPLVDDGGTPVSIPASPRRIVSLIPATTELVFALGAGDRLVGRTSWCDYPAEAAKVPDLGNGIGPNLEAVLGTRPDLVLLYYSPGNALAAGRLRDLGVAVLELRTDRIADLDRVARLLASVLGDRTAADTLLQRVHREIDAGSAPAAPPAGRPTVLLLSWDRPPITLGRGSFLSEIVERAGARNAFDDLAAPSAPVSIEAIAARNPAFILTSSVDLPAIASRPEWAVVPAVREHRFLRMQGSEFNRPSPRIGSAITALRATLDSMRR